MQRLKTLIIAASALLAACSTSYNITEVELQHYLDKELSKQTLQYSGPMGVELNLNSAQVTVGSTPNKITLISDAAIRLETPIMPLQALLTLQVEAQPYYDSHKQAIYLKDVELSGFSTTPKQVEWLLQPLSGELSAWLNVILSGQPIYTLDQTDWRQELLGRFGQQIDVKPGHLQFILQP